MKMKCKKLKFTVTYKCHCAEWGYPECSGFNVMLSVVVSMSC